MENIVGKTSYRLWLTAACSALVILAGCGGGGSDDNPGPLPTAQSDWSTLGARTATAQGGRTITGNQGAQWTSTYAPPATHAGTAVQPLQYITMRDGKRLAAYLTLPADADGNPAPGPFPTVLVQTAYNGVSGQFVPALGGADELLVTHGYASITVDVRGTGQSEGQWEAFGPEEQADYAEVVDWVVRQPWCDGRIGVQGVSYLGITAIITAAQGHPSIKAAFPIVPIGDGYRDIVFTGGQVNPTFIPLWLGLVSVLGVTNPTVLTDPTIGIPVVLEHVLSAVTNFQVPTILKALVGEAETAYDGAFWQARSPLEIISAVRVPTFVVGGLRDLFQRSEPMSYEVIKRNTVAKLLMGPWTHIQAAMGMGLPADGVPTLSELTLQWFDQYVKGLDVGADRLPNVTQWVTGLDRYVTASDWPHPKASAQRLYLRGDKSLSTTTPAADERSNVAAQVPILGLCSVSSAQWTAGLLGLLPVPCFSNGNVVDSGAINYQTEPMAEDYYLNGPIEADIWMATTAIDAGLSVRVDDVAPNGRVTPLTNGLQTASLRAVDERRSRKLDGQSIQPWHPFTQESVLPVGINTPVMVPVEVFQTSALIAKGHRLRIAVSASNLPQGVPPLPTLLQSLAGVLTIYSDAARPSSVVIPVVPASALTSG